MNRSPKQFGWTGLVLAGLVSLWPAPGAGSESFGVYEDWKSARTIRSDRWIAREDGAPAQDVALGIEGHDLVMRQRRQGAVTSDTGITAAIQTLFARNPSAIDQMEVDVDVRRMEVSGCEANPGQTSVRPALLAFGAFNDGTPGGQTGDHYIQVQVNGPADTIDRASLLDVQANVVRCSNASCSVGDSPVYRLGIATIPVSTPFTLRAIWDRANHRFLVGVNGDPDVELVYDPALDTGNARVPFASVRTALLTANCTAGRTLADAEVAIGVVRTNVSAIIP